MHVLQNIHCLVHVHNLVLLKRLTTLRPCMYVLFKELRLSALLQQSSITSLQANNDQD